MQRIFRRTPMPKMISIKLLCNFIEIIVRHECSPVNLLHIFRTPFPKNNYGLRSLLKMKYIIHQYRQHFSFRFFYHTCLSKKVSCKLYKKICLERWTNFKCLLWEHFYSIFNVSIMGDPYQKMVRTLKIEKLLSAFFICSCPSSYKFWQKHGASDLHFNR